ncbi:MAG TPA: hypothetical protein DF383_11105 [Deltaproteobacteria bacterium]|nr:hypothetical protein [Deltaproteobacteria bacterium]
MKKYRVRLAPDIRRSLRHFHPGLKTKIRRALEELEQDPLLGKPLKESLAGLHSYRVTQYRIIYRINRNEILVEVIEQLVTHKKLLEKK